ncbi:hypothetical protein ANN_21595 [Periplaneta americana]|uniref:Uncharacterized protein n=1 Tax=Periplaneta americana TaxID=6978 RepID=A0ABQ8S6I0_PERAM|nr:hypothetical protein ANN_21595 [Periplaneta americana]
MAGLCEGGNEPAGSLKANAVCGKRANDPRSYKTSDICLTAHTDHDRLQIRGAIACLLRNKGWEVHEEVHCISEDDSHRRADIIAINRQQQKAIIIDPTIRMERDLNQAHQVDQEKRAIYEPCIPYLSAKYNIPLFNWHEFAFESDFLGLISSGGVISVSEIRKHLRLR